MLFEQVCAAGLRCTVYCGDVSQRNILIRYVTFYKQGSHTEAHSLYSHTNTYSTTLYSYGIPHSYYIAVAVKISIGKL